MSAMVYTSPIDEPDFDDSFVDGRYDMEVDRKNEREFLEKLTALARLNGDDPAIGKELRWGRGDGYARYMVWKTEPLELIWLQLGDAWEVEDALLRGLELSDVRSMVEHGDRLAEMFGRSG